MDGSPEESTQIERMFEDGKGELGRDHFEVRKYLALRRHLILSCVSYQFLAEFQQEHRGGKSGVDGLPDSHGDLPVGPAVESWGPLFAEVGRGDPAAITGDSATQREGRPLPPQTNASPPPCHRAESSQPTNLSLAAVVAL
jgi:hypothetical protein